MTDPLADRMFEDIKARNASLQNADVTDLVNEVERLRAAAAQTPLSVPKHFNAEQSVQSIRYAIHFLRQQTEYWRGAAMAFAVAGASKKAEMEAKGVQAASNAAVQELEEVLADLTDSNPF